MIPVSMWKCVHMDELCRQNQILEANVHNIQQHQHKATSIKEMEVLDHQPLLDKLWEALVPKGFKPPSLVKFDGCSDTYEHVTSITIKMANI